MGDSHFFAFPFSAAVERAMAEKNAAELEKRLHGDRGIILVKNEYEVRVGFNSDGNTPSYLIGRDCRFRLGLIENDIRIDGERVIIPVRRYAVLGSVPNPAEVRLKDPLRGWEVRGGPIVLESRELASLGSSLERMENQSLQDVGLRESTQIVIENDPYKLVAKAFPFKLEEYAGAAKVLGIRLPQDMAEKYREG